MEPSGIRQVAGCEPLPTGLPTDLMAELHEATSFWPAKWKRSAGLCPCAISRRFLSVAQAMPRGVPSQRLPRSSPSRAETTSPMGSLRPSGLYHRPFS